jgi:Na+-driven multidrug efflux pump
MSDNNTAFVDTTLQDREMRTGHIGKLLIKYSMTAIVGQLMQVVWIVFDGIFVGATVGAEGFAAYSIISPLYVFAQAIGLMIAVGACSLSGVALGEGKRERARQIFGRSMWYAFILSLIIAVLAVAFAAPMARAMGATEDLVEPCVGFIRVFFLGFPVVVLGFVLYEYVRLDEQPVIGALLLCIPPIYGVLIDYVCYFKLDLNIASSAWGYVAVVGSWALGAVYFLVSKKTPFKMKKSDIKPDWKDIGLISKTGLASFGVQLSIFFIGMLTNNLLAVYGSTMDKAAFGILNGYIINIFTVCVSIGFAIGVQPLASYNIGAKLYDRAREAFRLCMIQTLAIMGVATVVVFLFGRPIIGAFAGGDAATVEGTLNPMYITMVMFWFGSAAMISSAYFQAIRADAKGILNGLTRNTIFAIPVMLIAAKLAGVTGIWAAYPISDVGAGIVAIIMMIAELKRLKKLEREDPEVQVAEREEAETLKS